MTKIMLISCFEKEQSVMFRRRWPRIIPKHLRPESPKKELASFDFWKTDIKHKVCLCHFFPVLCMTETHTNYTTIFFLIVFTFKGYFYTYNSVKKLRDLSVVIISFLREKAASSLIFQNIFSNLESGSCLRSQIKLNIAQRSRGKGFIVVNTLIRLQQRLKYPISCFRG